jgi:hypothetical protein
MALRLILRVNGLVQDNHLFLLSYQLVVPAVVFGVQLPAAWRWAWKANLRGIE